LTIGVAYRVVNPDNLAVTYADSPEEMAKVVESSPEGGFHGQGVTFHVRGADDGHEYLRFDCFPDVPHYHYLPPPGDVQHVVDFDTAAHGEMLPWALECLRHRLPAMLGEVGAEGLAAQLDQGSVDRFVDRAAELAREAQQHR
jgi:hypothetical protein